MVLGSNLQSFKECECQEEDKRWSTNACLYFYYVLSSLFFFLNSLNIIFFLLSYYSLLFMATSFPFILLDSMGFLPFVPKTSPIVFGFLWASLQDYPLTRWLLGHYLLLRVCLLHHSSFQDKTPYFISPPPPFCLTQMDKDWKLSLSTYPYGMHQVALTHCFPLLGEMSSQQGIFPKRSLSKNPKIKPFSSHHQTTPSESLDQ